MIGVKNSIKKFIAQQHPVASSNQSDDEQRIKLSKDHRRRKLSPRRTICSCQQKIIQPWLRRNDVDDGNNDTDPSAGKTRSDSKFAPTPNKIRRCGNNGKGKCTAAAAASRTSLLHRPRRRNTCPTTTTTNATGRDFSSLKFVASSSTAIFDGTSESATTRSQFSDFVYEGDSDDERTDRRDTMYWEDCQNITTAK